MLVLATVAGLSTTLAVGMLLRGDSDNLAAIKGVAFCLWLTVLFVNFTEALALGHLRLKAEALEQAQDQVIIRKPIDLVKEVSRLAPPHKTFLLVMLINSIVVFLVAAIVRPLLPHYGVGVLDQDITIAELVILVAALAPTTTGGLMRVVEIAGLSRLIQHRVVPLSPRAMEIASTVDVLLLDKTAVAVSEQSQAVAFTTLGGTPRHRLAEAAHSASLADAAPLGQSIATLAKEDVKERLSLLRGMGTMVILTTNDPPLLAAAIAAEVGMDDFLPRSTPEARLKLMRRFQVAGYRVAVAGSGSDDAVVVDSADLSLALDTDAQLTHRVAAMVDLDSNPAKLIDIVAISKQWLLARRALTAFSVVADVIKQFVLIPAVFFSTCPALDIFDFMRIPSPTIAILSGIIFNTLLITALAPILWHAFSHRPLSPAHVPHNIPLVYGLCGLAAPLIGIYLIGLILARLG